MAKYIANILTCCRILGGVVLLFFPAFSTPFYILYLFCGVSDMIDGTIARKTNSASKLGSQLDTIADFVFVVVALCKLLPAFYLPWWLWVWGGGIALLKLGNILLGYISTKKFIALHTVMNKATGLLLFLLPLTISIVEVQYSLIAVCALATLSALQEGFYVITNGDDK